MAETTQSQLLELAKKHEANRAVKTILISLTEAQAQARIYLRSLELTTQSLTKAASLEEGYRVGWSHSDMVTIAANANAELAKMSALFVTLSSVLVSLGEEVNY
ncbi:hypothetical protein [Burkholderia gladioli]|uniref:hypothetical protein n=1 Tax=Burkholderia gladioli TaxID=28095 RepID=UPI0016419FDA|nr:hypothetical protein [Burkholderia gladioli]